MDKMIRFITTKYEDLFKLPDGGVVEVTFPDRQFLAKCEYVDNYHLRFGGDTLHICQLAEMMERGNGTCKLEEEIMVDQTAWKIGNHGYLMLQTSEDGYDYTFYDADLHELDGGQLDDTELSMNEARDMLLEDNGWNSGIMTMEDYDDLAERIDAKEMEAMTEKRESVLEKLMAPAAPICANHTERIRKEEVR